MKISNNTLGYILILALLSATGFVSVNLFFQERYAYDKLDINKFPHIVGVWQGKDIEIPEEDYDIL